MTNPLALIAVSLLAQDPGTLAPELADLVPRWQEAMEACGVPALALVLVEGEGDGVQRVTLGHRDPEGTAPVTPDTIFYIASATKPYVAFALAQLAEEGKLDLDAPVRSLLPRFRLADPGLTETIRVRDLLCHRYGLNSMPIVLLDAYTGEITEDRYYHFLAEVESPGHMAYSNVHFTLAGRVIEAVSGMTWRDFLAERVFRPAGMTRTTGYADWMYAQDDVALPAVLAGGRPVRSPLRKSDRTMHAAGGLGTSIDDLARWIRLQLGRGRIGDVRLLSESAVEATWRLECEGRDDSGFGAMDGFGLGWQRGSYRGHLELRHGGGYVGAGSYVCFLPELGLGLGILATGASAGAVVRLVSTDVHERLLADDEERDLLPALLADARSERARAARQEAEGEARHEAEPAPDGGEHATTLSLSLETYAGLYRDEWFGTLTLEVRDSRLVGHLGQLSLELVTPEPDRLLVVSSATDGVEGRFVLDAERVVACELDLVGPVRFARVAGRLPERGPEPVETGR